MKRQISREGSPYTLGDEVDVGLLESLISLLDGYLVYRFADPRKLEKGILEGRLGAKLAKGWKEIRSALDLMGDFPLSAANVRRIVRMEFLIGLLQKFFTVLTFVFIFIFFMLRGSLGNFAMAYVYSITLFVLAVTGLFVARQYAIRKLSLAIVECFERNPERFKEKRAFLRKTVQSLIFGLCETLGNNDQKGEDHSFVLDNVDYEGISVVTKPGRFRKYYVVVPVLNT